MPPQVTPKPTTEHRPPDWFKPDARELARHDDPEEIRRMGEDLLANGQLQPVGATEDGRIIFGHGRWLAAKAAGLKTLEVKLYPATLPDTQFKLIRAAENLQRKDLTGYQKWVLCDDLMRDNPRWQMQDLAAHLHIDPSMVTRLLSPSKCVKEWQAALEAGTVGITDCYQASPLPEAEQVALLAFKLRGKGGKKASRDALAEKARELRKGNGTPEVPGGAKSSRVVCPLSVSTQVVVSGPNLTLDSVIDRLVEALDAARQAKRQSQDARTFSAWQRNKVKNGGQNHAAQ